MNTCTIAIGTTSTHKLTATKSALRHARLDRAVTLAPVKTVSGVAEQPLWKLGSTDNEIATGALCRATAALAATPGASYGLGIENGLVEFEPNQTYVDLAVIALVAGYGIEPLFVTSCGIPFPKAHVRSSLDSKRATTAGDFIAQATGCDGTDPHSYLTRGRVSRAEMLEQAIESALSMSPLIEYARKPYLYLASSWRNPQQPAAVEAFREAGFEVYDFRSPAPGNKGFAWVDVAPHHKHRDAHGFVTKAPAADILEGLRHPTSLESFDFDYGALMRADATVLLMPCGRSAHLELGYAIGARQRTAIILAEEQEPELMWKMADVITTSVAEAVQSLRGLTRQTGATTAELRGR